MYIVGTPIGNLEDISARAIRTLKEVDLIFAEDTRVSIKLLSQLKKHALAERSIALISDAGMPLVSDPGYMLVQEAIHLGLEIICMPGPSSVLVALACSGLPCQRFCFEGFLPDKASQRRERLAKLKDDERTLVFFLPPSDLPKILAEINEIMGNRPATLCRELTKLHEEYIRSDVLDILKISGLRQLKGECVLVLSGSSKEVEILSREELEVRLSGLLACGARLKDAASLLSRETGWSSSDIYKVGLKLRDTNQ